MATTLILFLVALLFIVAVIYCIQQAATAFPSIPARIINIAVVIVFLVLFLILLNYLGVSLPG